jgi:hypothetical protein
MEPVPVRGADADLEALIDSTEAFSALLPSDEDGLPWLLGHVDELMP